MVSFFQVSVEMKFDSTYKSHQISANLFGAAAAPEKTSLLTD
jgi:hypothetical protein